MRKGKEIDALIAVLAKGGAAGGERILEDDIENGLAYLVTSASGSPASFPDGADGEPVVGLKVSILPVQEGSGDPDPDNVRPISGWTGLTLSHSGEDTSDPETLTVSWQSSAGTVYGGTLNVTTGVLTVDRALVDLGTLTGWFQNAGGESTKAWLCSLADVKTMTGAGRPNFLCTAYPTVTTTEVFNGTFGISLWSTTKNIAIHDDTYLNSTAAQFKAAMSGVKLVYPLATPSTYQLSSHDVETLLGDNNVWANCGPVEVEYRADLEKYIEKRKNGGGGAGTLGFGLSPSLIRPGTGLETQSLGLDDAGVDYINDMPDADEYLGDPEDDEESYPEEPEEEDTEEEEPEEELTEEPEDEPEEDDDGEGN